MRCVFGRDDAHGHFEALELERGSAVTKSAPRATTFNPRGFVFLLARPESISPPDCGWRDLAADSPDAAAADEVEAAFCGLISP